VGRDHLVLDLSCKRIAGANTGDSVLHGKDCPRWKIAINRWQTLIDIEITAETLNDLARYCDEFLIHAADVEGKQQGMDDELIVFLAENSPIPCTYAGGAKSLADLEHCKQISNGKIDLTIGSALDLFGGKGVKYEDCVRFNKA
jgi:phosphoribosylformimino-5-aminoimidazole carboxamide ribotide isomerase